MSLRPVKEVLSTTPTLEGAGVRLQRAFGFGKTKEFDPFLLLDDFRNDHPADYLAGFPWHPHRGIETITYVLAGSVEHGDSLGNKGKMTAGDVQWMTAGSGILHQEMPKGDERGRMHGFQLWANLPSRLKMTDPRYQDIPSSAIPEVTDDDGTTARIISGELLGPARTRSTASPPTPATSTSAFRPTSASASRSTSRAMPSPTSSPELAPSAMPPSHAPSSPSQAPTPTPHPSTPAASTPPTTPWSSSTAATRSRSRPVPEGIRFLLVSGQPIEEPVAWHGPIVMNTQQELRQAMHELQDGRFIKHR